MSLTPFRKHASHLDLDAIRAKLGGVRGSEYWRSLEEIAETDEFRRFIDDEFPERATDWAEPGNRRTFLKLMGASLALAGVTACTKQPHEAIVPYVRQPEDIVRHRSEEAAGYAHQDGAP